MGLLPLLVPEKKDGELAKRLKKLLTDMKDKPLIPLVVPQSPEQSQATSAGSQQAELTEKVELSEEECYEKVFNDPGAWSGSSLMGAGDRSSILPR